jgi:hypothetical protein
MVQADEPSAFEFFSSLFSRIERDLPAMALYQGTTSVVPNHALK